MYWGLKNLFKNIYFKKFLKINRKTLDQRECGWGGSNAV